MTEKIPKPDRESKMCCICQAAGRTSKLRLFQINLDEAITLCSHPKCTYPIGAKSLDELVVTRSLSTESVSPNQAKVTSTNHTVGKAAVKRNICINKNDARIAAKFPCYGTIPEANHRELEKISNPTFGQRSSVCVSPVANATSKSISNATSLISSDSITSRSLSIQNISNKCQQSSETFQSNVPVDDDSISRSKTSSDINQELSNLSSYIFLQWQNRDALCWLDVIMCMLVHSSSLQSAMSRGTISSDSIVAKILSAYHKALVMVNSHKDFNVAMNDSSKSLTLNHNFILPESCSQEYNQQTDFRNNTHIPLQTGAGIKSSVAKLILQGQHKEAMEDPSYSSAIKYLHDIRDEVFLAIQKKLKCEKGKNDSPVQAMPVLLSQNKFIEELFRLKYRIQFSCDHCQLVQNDVFEKTLPSFPSLIPDVSIDELKFEVACVRCNAVGMKMVTYERVPDILTMHFIDGLPFSDLKRLEFVANEHVYTVSSIVQYKNNPDHFVTWIRKNGDVWIECDDLKSPVCQAMTKTPTFQPKQIHIVMWEKSSKPVPETKSSACNVSLSIPSLNVSINAKTSVSGKNSISSPNERSDSPKQFFGKQLSSESNCNGSKSIPECSSPDVMQKQNPECASPDVTPNPPVSTNCSTVVNTETAVRQNQLQFVQQPPAERLSVNHLLTRGVGDPVLERLKILQQMFWNKTAGSSLNPGNNVASVITNLTGRSSVMPNAQTTSMSSRQTFVPTPSIKFQRNAKSLSVPVNQVPVNHSSLSRQSSSVSQKLPSRPGKSNISKMQLNLELVRKIKGSRHTKNKTAQNQGTKRPLSTPNDIKSEKETTTAINPSNDSTMSSVSKRMKVSDLTAKIMGNILSPKSMHLKAAAAKKYNEKQFASYGSKVNESDSLQESKAGAKNKSKRTKSVSKSEEKSLGKSSQSPVHQRLYSVKEINQAYTERNQKRMTPSRSRKNLKKCAAEIQNSERLGETSNGGCALSKQVDDSTSISDSGRIPSGSDTTTLSRDSRLSTNKLLLAPHLNERFVDNPNSRVASPVIWNDPTLLNSMEFLSDLNKGDNSQTGPTAEECSILQELYDALAISRPVAENTPTTENVTENMHINDSSCSPNEISFSTLSYT